MEQRSNLVLTLAVSALLTFNAGLISHAAADTVEVELDTGEIIELDGGVIRTCEGEGLNLGACACVVSIMLEAEGVDSLSLTEMTRLANAYPREYDDARAHCIAVN